MYKIILRDGVYYFVTEDGVKVDLKTWLEVSKKNAAHPDGKLWIKLPKNNPTNREYFSVDKFNAEAVNGEVIVEVKTTEKRVLGSSSFKQDIVKYLDEETAAEYTDMCTRAVEAYKEAKASKTKKKLEEMNKEELEAFIAALQNGTKVPTVAGPKSFIDMFTDEENARYNDIIALAMENKANMPKAKRGPLSDEEKAARKIKRDAKTLSKAQELLAALQAAQSTDEDFE